MTEIYHPVISKKVCKRPQLEAEIERLRAEVASLSRLAEDDAGTIAFLRQEIERLRAAGKKFADWIEELYGSLSRERAPGPPITLLHEMRAAFEQKEVRK